MTDTYPTSPEPAASSAQPLSPGGEAQPVHQGAVQLYGPEFATNPTALYSRMRSRPGGVTPVLLDGDVPAWFVHGYREVHHVTGNPDLFGRDCRRWNAWDRVPEKWPLLPYVGWTPSVMFAEGAEHQRRAGAIGDALDAIDRTELRSVCEQICDQMINAFVDRGEADLIADYSHQIPLRVIATLFGLPDSDIPVLARDVAESLDANENANTAHQRIHARMQQLVKDKAARPGRDVPSRLLSHPVQLAVDQIVIDLLVVMAAAQQPTGNWIGNTLRLMLVDDQFSITLQGGRSSVAQALNEVLWQDTPTQNFIGRWPVRDCELGGHHIRKGDLLVLGLAAANTDPHIHPDPRTGATANRAHMSFGHGEHGCPFPAPELAETIAKTAVEVLLDRLPDMELAVPANELNWRSSLWMRGLEAIPVTFTPAPGTTPGDR